MIVFSVALYFRSVTKDSRKSNIENSVFFCTLCNFDELKCRGAQKTGGSLFPWPTVVECNISYRFGFALEKEEFYFYSSFSEYSFLSKPFVQSDCTKNFCFYRCWRLLDKFWKNIFTRTVEIGFLHLSVRSQFITAVLHIFNCCYILFHTFFKVCKLLN